MAKTLDLETLKELTELLSSEIEAEEKRDEDEKKYVSRVPTDWFHWKVARQSSPIEICVSCKKVGRHDNWCACDCDD